MENELSDTFIENFGTIQVLKSLLTKRYQPKTIFKNVGNAFYLYKLDH